MPRPPVQLRPRPSGEPPPAASEALAPLEREAVEPEVDPAGPAGDVAAEIAAFSDLRSCVKRHRVVDPVLADALEAIGYDSFAFDACRMVQALKDQDAARCEPILSSAVRGRCEAQVAMIAGNTSLCPTDEHVPGVPMHDVVCLAAARRDVRPCAALLGMERAGCEGLVAHDVARCGTDERCARSVRRWKPVLPLMPGKSPHAGRIEAEVRSLDEQADGGESSLGLELAREAAVGAVLVHRGRRVRLLIGDPRTFFVTDEISGGGLLIELPAWPPEPGELRLTTAQVRATLRHRPLGTLELTVASVTEVQIEQLDTRPNSPVKLRATTQLGPQRTSRRVAWTIDTWLRDVVEVPDEPRRPLLPLDAPRGSPARPHGSAAPVSSAHHPRR
jgi:hypothetical protein